MRYTRVAEDIAEAEWRGLESFNNMTELGETVKHSNTWTSFMAQRLIALEKDLSSVEAEKDKLNARIQELEKQLAEANLKVEAAIAKASSSSKIKNRAEAKVEVLRERINALEAELTKAAEWRMYTPLLLQTSLVAQRLIALAKDLSSAEAEKDQLNARIQELEKQLVEANLKVEAAMVKASSSSKIKKRVEAKVEVLRERINALEAELTEVVNKSVGNLIWSVETKSWL
ncbi:uncharacterized protein LOC133815328 [Humulus lupulus]|uniref:uncharacterized protein LOC133815328 n=1 Tax=Humulus lupulus TaxID=3486 RepID=UPI002B408C1C|nr:uncharacterized protein LOC133815328 [Humulus lupulus]